MNRHPPPGETVGPNQGTQPDRDRIAIFAEIDPIDSNSMEVPEMFAGGAVASLLAAESGPSW
jgi:hypothetical protein